MEAHHVMVGTDVTHNAVYKAASVKEGFKLYLFTRMAQACLGYDTVFEPSIRFGYVIVF